MIRVRRLRRSDAAQVSLLIPQLTQNIVKPENLVDRLRDLVDQTSSDWLVATELDGHIVGFGGLVWYSIPSKGMIAWIEEVVVDQTSRNQGIGYALIEALLLIAWRIDAVQVKLTSKAMATGLYRKFGFVKKDEEYLVKKFS